MYKYCKLSVTNMTCSIFITFILILLFLYFFKKIEVTRNVFFFFNENGLIVKKQCFCFIYFLLPKKLTNE